MLLRRPVELMCLITLHFGPYPPALVPLVHTSFHNAIDFAPPQALKNKTINILAAADGTILNTGFNSAYGNFIIISHITPQNLMLTFYCHLEKIKLFRGSNVLRREKIATMGTTGISTGKHLHFMLATLGPSGINFIDPEPHFA